MTGGSRFSGFAGPNPSSGTLYAASGGPTTSTDLYTLNANDGSATSIGPTGFGITGLAVHPGTGVLYGITSNQSIANARSLISINTSTGAGTFIGPTGVANGIADIGFRSDGVLFGYGATTHRLYTINLATGAASTVGAFVFVGGTGFGMDFDGNDLLFVCPLGDNGMYYTVDSTTGAQTAQIALNGAPGPAGLSVSAASFTTPAVFYATLINSAGDDYLVTINTMTGAITNIGVTLTNADGLAWVERATTGAPHPN